MADIYQHFEELQQHQEEGKDFEVEIIDRKSGIIVVAIHGGNIEPGTTEIAKAIAGEEFSFYGFAGKSTIEESQILHITSTNFDEPRCASLISHSSKVISVHGLASLENFIMLGGLDKELIRKLHVAFINAGFELRPALEYLNGNSSENICNKGTSGKGIQIELARGLRDMLVAEQKSLLLFVQVLRDAL